MSKTDSIQTKLTPWVMFLIVMTIPFLSWASAYDWDLNRLFTVKAFPLLGLWAWSIMWTHYAYESLQLLSSRFQKNQLYLKVSGAFVLLFLLLHPGLLALQQYSTTGTLPPDSYYNYVGKDGGLFIIFGLIALIIFLSFEVFDRIKSKPAVMRNWKWVSLTQMIAMTLIFFHGLGIGRVLESPGIELYWVVLGALLIPCFGVVGRNDWK